MGSGGNAVNQKKGGWGDFNLVERKGGGGPKRLGQGEDRVAWL